MKEVWIVEVGEYSGRHIEAVFSTEQKARAWAEEHREGSWGAASPTCWEIDSEDTKDDTLPLFLALFCLTTKGVEEFRIDQWDQATPDLHDGQIYEWTPAFCVWGFRCFVRAKIEELARKIAVEKFQEYVAKMAREGRPIERAKGVAL